MTGFTGTSGREWECEQLQTRVAGEPAWNDEDVTKTHGGRTARREKLTRASVRPCAAGADRFSCRLLRDSPQLGLLPEPLGVGAVGDEKGLEIVGPRR